QPHDHLKPQPFLFHSYSGVYMVMPLIQHYFNFFSLVCCVGEFQMFPPPRRPSRAGLLQQGGSG
ncbi:MAG: hypothetical protein FWC24_04495, partial [Treponema sp.]|nr:hypothetical protein [Treponema sp.]